MSTVGPIPVDKLKRARYDLCLDDPDAGPLPAALRNASPRKNPSLKTPTKPKIPAWSGQRRAASGSGRTGP